MTAENLVRIALALKGEDSDMIKEYEGYAVDAVNVILAESLPLENQMRYVNGIKELDTAPMISSLSDEIDYDMMLLTTCLSYGVAAKLTIDDSDHSRFNYFNGMYMQAFLSGTKGKFERISDMEGC